ncbi:hypothetical protein FHG55_22340 [Pseudomonas jessenii]|uniref:Uncharacterized protein n=1 Tax=Pseudomonas jessenii TaxID=77298 RepID=A0A5C4KU85_PSEJE|nr:hypothetical protein FHG55_22340 [Pseudomonas jessenii]
MRRKKPCAAWARKPHKNSNHNPIKTVGAGLLAKAVCQSLYIPTDPPLSRASPLPQGGNV